MTSVDPLPAPAARRKRITLFSRGCLSAVELIHHHYGSTVEEHEDGLDGKLDSTRSEGRLFAFGSAQHVLDRFSLVPRFSDAYEKAHEGFRAQAGSDRLQSLVASRGAPKPQTAIPRREIQAVAHHEDLVRGKPSGAKYFREDPARSIHVGERFYKDHGGPAPHGFSQSIGAEQPLF